MILKSMNKILSMHALRCLVMALDERALGRTDLEPCKLAEAYAKKLDLKITADRIRSIYHKPLVEIDQLPDVEWCGCIRNPTEARLDIAVYTPIAKGQYAKADCQRCKGQGISKKIT